MTLSKLNDLQSCLLKGSLKQIKQGKSINIYGDAHLLHFPQSAMLLYQRAKALCLSRIKKILLAHLHYLGFPWDGLSFDFLGFGLNKWRFPEGYWIAHRILVQWTLSIRTPQSEFITSLWVLKICYLSTDIHQNLTDQATGQKAKWKGQRC